MMEVYYIPKTKKVKRKFLHCFEIPLQNENCCQTNGSACCMSNGDELEEDVRIKL